MLNTPDRTRTCDLQFRKLPLYPPELRGRKDLRQVVFFDYSRYYSRQSLHGTLNPNEKAGGRL